MGRTRSIFLSATALVVVAGCSPVTRFYTLAKVDGESVLTSAATQPLVIALGPVTLPDYVDRPQIVVRDGPYTVTPATFDQWAGDLDDMLPQVLIENLAVRLPGDRIVPFPRLSGPSFDYRVAVDIIQLDVSSAGEAVVAAGLQVYDRSGMKLVAISDASARSAAQGTNAQDHVAAISQALGSLSSDIARAVAALPRGELQK